MFIYYRHDCSSQNPIQNSYNVLLNYRDIRRNFTRTKAISLWAYLPQRKVAKIYNSSRPNPVASNIDGIYYLRVSSSSYIDGVYHLRVSIIEAQFAQLDFVEKIWDTAEVVNASSLQRRWQDMRPILAWRSQRKQQIKKQCCVSPTWTAFVEDHTRILLTFC